MDIKVLGACCGNCSSTLALIQQVAKDKGVAVTLAKVEDLREIMSYGVMSTPGVVVDGKVVHAGGIPTRDKIEQWLAGTASSAAQPMPEAGACCGGARSKCCG